MTMPERPVVVVFEDVLDYLYNDPYFTNYSNTVLRKYAASATHNANCGRLGETKYDHWLSPQEKRHIRLALDSAFRACH